MGERLGRHRPRAGRQLVNIQDDLQRVQGLRGQQPHAASVRRRLAHRARPEEPPPGQQHPLVFGGGSTSARRRARSGLPPRVGGVRWSTSPTGSTRSSGRRACSLRRTCRPARSTRRTSSRPVAQQLPVATLNAWETEIFKTTDRDVTGRAQRARAARRAAPALVDQASCKCRREGEGQEQEPRLQATVASPASPVPFHRCRTPDSTTGFG